MPHYADGTKAAVGDLVLGKPYNTGHLVQGVVVDVRPGDSCNLTVAFAERLAMPAQLEGGGEPPRAVVVVTRTDYGATKDFQKLTPSTERPSVVPGAEQDEAHSALVSIIEKVTEGAVVLGPLADEVAKRVGTAAGAAAGAAGSELANGLARGLLERIPALSGLVPRR